MNKTPTEKPSGVAIKPVLLYRTVLQALQDDSSGEAFFLPAGSTLQQPSAKERYVWLIEYGFFTLTRLSDDISISSGQAPSIFGLAEIFDYRGDYRLVAETPCRGLRIPALRFTELVTRHALWADIGGIFSYMLHLLMVRDATLITGSAYPVIRSLLLELMKLPEDIRLSITALDFILQRSRLSRSNTLRILAELRKGECITTENGRLLHIRHLPAKY